MTFDEYTSRQARQQEIAATRVGFLGGSDAALVYRAAECGVDGLSNTDIKRLKVLFGCTPPDEWGGNQYTKAGHDFEDYIADYLPNYMGVQAEREKVMRGKQYKNFATQAHADFCTADGVVFECKCVAKKTTERVEKDYYAQLQWYYMLGAKMVYLVHGRSATEIADIVPIKRNDGYIIILRNGCELIDCAIDRVCAATVSVTVSADSTPATIQEALANYVDVTRQIQQLEELRDKIKIQLGTYMGENGLRCIEGECSVSVSKAGTVRKLKLRDVLRDFPQVADDKYYNFEERKPYLTFRKIRGIE